MFFIQDGQGNDLEVPKDLWFKHRDVLLVEAVKMRELLKAVNNVELDSMHRVTEYLDSIPK